MLIGIQAWARCVTKDTTLVIFHCGNIERIGLRHRQTQTLYLSDVIDIHACKSPAYGKLHVGLYLAALEDVLDRVKQQLPAETEEGNSRHPADPLAHNGKRRLFVDEDDGGPPRKRVKTGHDSQSVPKHQLTKSKGNGRGTRKVRKGTGKNKDEDKREKVEDNIQVLSFN